MKAAEEIAQLQERLRRREDEVAVLQRIAMAVASAQDLPDVLQTIVHLAIQVMGCEKAAIFELDEDGHTLTVRAWEGLSQAYAESARSLDARTTRAQAVLRGEPLAVVDVHGDESEELRRLAEQEGYRAFIDVPLRSRETNLGLLSAYYADVHEFTADEIEMLVSFAGQAAVALETARLMREQKRRITELATLEEVGRAISSTLKLDELLERIYEQTSRLMDTTSFFLTLYYEETQEWEMRIQVEDGQRQPPMPRQKLRAGLTGWIIQHREPLLLKHGATDFLRQQGIDRIGRASKSWLGVPLLLGEQIVGVVAVQSYERERAYDEGHMRLLATIARQAAVAVANARLFENLERHIAEVAGLEEIGRAIGSTLELEQVLQRIYEQVSLLMDTTNFYIALHEPGTDLVSFPLAYEHGQPQTWKTRRQGQGLTEHVIATARPLLIRQHVGRELEARGVQVIGTEAQSWLGVPLQLGEQVVGVMAVQSYEETMVYDEEHQRILMAIGQQAAIVVENARTMARMRELNQDLQRNLETHAQLLETIRQLSTPVVPLMEGIIFLPLVGHIDSNRAHQIVEELLLGVQEHRARIVILDITGVPVVDTMVAQALVQAAQAVHLLGAEGVLVGIMPEVAQTMVSLGIDLAALVTRADLQSGLEYAITQRARWELY